MPISRWQFDAGRCERRFFQAVLFQTRQSGKGQSEMRTNGVMNGMMMGTADRGSLPSHIFLTRPPSFSLIRQKREERESKAKHTYNTVNCIPPERIPALRCCLPPQLAFQAPSCFRGPVRLGSHTFGPKKRNRDETIIKEARENIKKRKTPAILPQKNPSHFPLLRLSTAGI